MRTLRLRLGVMVMAVCVAGMSSGVAAQGDDAQPPVDISARFSCGGYYQDGQTTNVVLGPVGDGNLVRRETRGALSRMDVDEVSDPRLMGAWTLYQSWDEYVWPGVDLSASFPPSLNTTTLRMVSDEGAWQDTGHGAYLPGVLDPTDTPAWEPTVLRGEGGYEGLTAAMWTRLQGSDCSCWTVDNPCTWEVRGYVIEGALPPPPEILE